MAHLFRAEPLTISKPRRAVADDLALQLAQEPEAVLLAGPARLRVALEPARHLQPGLRARGDPAAHGLPPAIVLVELAHHRRGAQTIDLGQQRLRGARPRRDGPGRLARDGSGEPEEE